MGQNGRSEPTDQGERKRRAGEIVAAEFHSREGLIEAVAARTFDRPPAIVCNAHVTGLAVARGLAGRVRYPLDDREGFRANIEAIAARLGS